LLAGLGVPPFAACLSTLISNSTPTAFGAVGIPPVTGFNTIVPGIAAAFPDLDPAVFGSQFYSRLGLTNIFIGSFMPVMLIATIVLTCGSRPTPAGCSSNGGISSSRNGSPFRNGILPIVPMCIFSGLIFTVPVYFIATYIGPEIPSMLGALIGLALLLTAVKTGFLVPREIWRFPDDPVVETRAAAKKVSLPLAWSPYIAITVLLMVTRLPWFPIRAWINDPAHSVVIKNILGFDGIDWNFKIFNNPGLFPFIIVATAYMAAGRLKSGAIKTVVRKTAGQVKNAVIALLFGVALVQIMRYTDYSIPGGRLEAMTTEVAKTLAAVFGGMYPLMSPFVGAFGAFVAGSNTVSNIMFMPLQFQAALLVGLPTVMIALSQSLGGAIGNMVCVHNVVAVTATTGATGSEGRLIAAAALPCVAYCLMLSATLFIYLAVGISWVA
jgi:lactate permease